MRANLDIRSAAGSLEATVRCIASVMRFQNVVAPEGVAVSLMIPGPDTLKPRSPSLPKTGLQRVLSLSLASVQHGGGVPRLEDCRP